VDFLERRRVNRGVGVALVLVAGTVLLLGIVLLLIPVIVNQASRVSERLPAAVVWLDTDVIPRIEATFGIKLPQTPGDLLAQARAHLQDMGPGIATHVGQLVIKSVGGALGALGAIANFLLVPFIAFYLTRDYHEIWPRFEALVPARRVEAVRRVVRDVDKVLSGFVRGQLTVALLLGVLTAIGLAIVRIDGALVIGLIAGLLNMVPYLGSVVSITLALTMAVLKFAGWWPIIGVGIVFAITHLAEQFVITPRIVGQSVGLSPVAVIVAVLAGGQLFGFVGVLLAVPAAAVLKVLSELLRQAYLESDAYRDGERPPQKPSAS
jgi:predicted PurR-regulated permease PerM